MLDRLFLSAGSTVTGLGWIGTLTSTSGENAIAVDSSGNVYVGCNPGQSLVKYNATGVLQWQRNVSTGRFFRDVTVDSSGNIYVAGSAFVSGVGSRAFLAKYNSSGTLQWQRTYLITGESEFFGVTTDSSGNVYVCGNAGNSSGGADGVCVKYDASGNLQFQRNMYNNDDRTAIVTLKSIKVDSSGNIYLVGNYAGARIIIFKLSNTGGLVWRKHNLNGIYGNGIEVDTSGNIYVVSQVFVSGSNKDIWTVKLDSTGSVLWQRSLSTYNNDGGTDCALDSSGNLYVIGHQDVIGPIRMAIAKYDTSGTLLFQRRMVIDTNLYGWSIATAGTSMYVAGTDISNQKSVFAKLPNDGSLTGAYSVGSTSVTYETMSMTASTPTYSVDNSPYALGGPSGTSETSTYTEPTSTLTSTVLEL